MQTLENLNNQLKYFSIYSNLKVAPLITLLRTCPRLDEKKKKIMTKNLNVGLPFPIRKCVNLLECFQQNLRGLSGERPLHSDNWSGMVHISHIILK